MQPGKFRTHRAIVCTLAIAGTFLSGAALAQPARQAPQPRAGVRMPDPIPQRETLIRLSRPITVDFRDQRLADIIAFIRDFSMAEIEPMWTGDRHSTGLDPDQLITVSVQNVTVLTLIERILEQARDDFSEGTWQMSETGALQIGPRDRLNRWKRVVVYDINDLLMEIPDFPEVPRIDLNQALQGAGGGGGGGGGGQSPFRGGDTEDRERDRQTRDARAEEIADLIREIVESEQWVENGGSGGSVRVFRGNLIVRAPDYMHRGIVGYPYWPSSATASRTVNGRRYVTLTTDNSISALAGMALQPVTATAPGQGGGAGGGGGGGGGGVPGGPGGGGR
jgi:hypothetical protein